MLYLIGLGLGDESDITRRGLEVVKGCKRILLESYTSILPGISKERLEELYGKPVEIAYREKVEEDIEEVILRKQQAQERWATVKQRRNLVLAMKLKATTYYLS